MHIVKNDRRKGGLIVLHYTEPIYRPPSEADDLFIQVTQGCSHNSCSFCGQFKDTPFRLSPMEQIEADIIEAAKLYPDKKRVYLLSGDPFVLSFDKLKQIGLWLNQYIPSLEAVAMFASINSIKQKTDAELKTLFGLKMNLLYLGIETGDPETLAFANKGHNVEEAYTQLKRLESVGIGYLSAYISGLTGDGLEKGLENARNSAAFFNKVPPVMLGVTSLSIWDNTEIGKLRREGKFIPAPELQMLEETRELLSGLTSPMLFSSIHVSNLVPVMGRIPEDRNEMLQTLDQQIAVLKNDGDIPRYSGRDGRM